MQIIPLQATPSQTLNIILADQNCKINVYAKSTGVYLDLFVNDLPIIAATICLDRVRLVREKYLNFMGDLTFIDMRGVDDPHYTGFGGRFLFIYLETSD